MSQFLTQLKNNVLVADGAIGTILYSEGLDTCPEAYNLSHPDKVERIHRSYIEAGADVIQTNTYGANFEKLKRFGLEDKVKAIHQAAVRIAKKAANKDTYILGTVGGFRGIKQEDISLQTILYHTEIQIDTLIEEGVDALLFETYYDLEELTNVISRTRKKYDIPIIAQLTASNTNYLVNGQAINEGLKQLVQCGANIVGLNCHHGPHHMQESFTHIELPEHAFLSCYPNASLLDIENSEFKYSDNAQYFGQVAQNLIREGVRLIGGCCGTTPEHIKFIKESIQTLKPVNDKKVIPIPKKALFNPSQNKVRQSLTSKVQERPTVIIELDTPKHLDTDRFFENIAKLDKANVDAVTLADNSLATVRISNIAAASLIKQYYNIEPLVHITCRDRNLIGLQSHLLGLSLIGVNEILAITGDPSKVGHLPGATNVYDVNSKGLTELALRFNQGINTDGDALKKRTHFNIAGAFNPNVRKLDGAVKRLEKKIEIGRKREWKKAIESYWAKKISKEELDQTLTDLHKENLLLQKYYHLDSIPVGDFSLYDHILDTSLLFNIIPERFQGRTIDDDLLFDIARGNKDHVASALIKWFNTNYHYIVPEWDNVEPKVSRNVLLDRFKYAQSLNVNAHPVIVGPITFVKLSKGGHQTFEEKVKTLLPLYKEVFESLIDAGAEYIQVDEPILVTDDSESYENITREAYDYFEKAGVAKKLVIQTYFERAHLKFLSSLPVGGLGLDFVHDNGYNLKQIEAGDFDKSKTLYAGIIDGRNVWASDIEAKKVLIDKLLAHTNELVIQPSSSLLHVPVSLDDETLDTSVGEGLSFATEKLDELDALRRLFNQNDSVKYDKLKARYERFQNQSFKNLDYDFESVRTSRQSPFAQRIEQQQKRLNLPDLPTTTIGSFPQSREVRKYRADWKNKRITDEAYETFLKNEIARWIKIQEDIGLDVLVHGEFERNDMVEFFGEKLQGFLVTKFGWVQSYGSRAVKPPIIYGDVKWTAPLTVDETVYAQSLTDKPVKGMLTGPVTILNWSFERVDLPRKVVQDQIALAINEEVLALEAAGIKVIQVDEPALREGLPLRSEYHEQYLKDAVLSFKLATSSVRDETQIHTHMCYSQFGQIIHAIHDLDADVISIETSRSHGDLIKDFEDINYDLGIGLGVYDIHSPRIPTKEEITTAINRSLQQIDRSLFWVNPDCGLKTRKEEEVKDALTVLVNAVKAKRQE